MAYLKPTLGTLGRVAAIVLGTQSGDPDNGSPEPVTGRKALDITAGLDD